MIFKEKFGSFECIATMCCLTFMPIILSLPRFSALEFGTGSFFQSIYMSIIALIFFLILYKLYKKFKNQDILDVSEFAGGKALKYITGVLIIFYVFSSALVTLSEYNEEIRNVLFLEAPSAFITIMFGITILLASFIGIKGIFRASTIIAPLIIIGLITILLSLHSNIDLTNFFPILGNDISSTFIKGGLSFGRYESLALLLLIVPNIKELGKTSLKAFLVVTFLIILSFFLIFGIIQYPSITENNLPLFEISRLISYGRFIERVESIIVLLSLINVCIYLSLGITLIANVIKKLFTIKYFKRIIPSLVVLLMSSNMLLSSYIDVLKFRRYLTVYIAPSLLFFYPLLLLLIANVKKNISDKKSQKLLNSN